MKAMRLNTWGQPVQLEDIPQPVPAKDEVLVRVHAASINPFDSFVQAGYMQGMVSTPLTLGTDFAGERRRAPTRTEVRRRGVPAHLELGLLRRLPREARVRAPGPLRREAHDLPLAVRRDAETHGRDPRGPAAPRRPSPAARPRDAGAAVDVARDRAGGHALVRRSLEVRLLPARRRGEGADRARLHRLARAWWDS